MAKIYATQVAAGAMLWTDIPTLWKKKACKLLEDGIMIDGEFKQFTLNADGTVTEVIPEPEEVEGVAEE